MDQNYQNIDKGSSGVQCILEDFALILILSRPGTATKGYCESRKWAIVVTVSMMQGKSLTGMLRAAPFIEH